MKMHIIEQKHRNFLMKRHQLLKNNYLVNYFADESLAGQLTCW